jgi:hypothetical protein
MGFKQQGDLATGGVSRTPRRRHCRAALFACRAALTLVVLAHVPGWAIGQPYYPPRCGAEQGTFVGPPGAQIVRPACDPLLEAALAYLRREMDVYHCRTVIYDDAESGGERFVPSGWMKGLDGENWGPAEIPDLSIRHWAILPHSGTTCLRIAWRPRRENEWVGVYWQRPQNNWGAYPGLNLSGARRLTFWARGATGREVVEFKFGGIDCRKPRGDPGKSRPPCNYVDSTSQPLSTGPLLLKPYWKQYAIDLSGHDLSCVLGGFCWVASALYNPAECVLYLDDVVIEHSRLDEPRLIRSYHAGLDPLTPNEFDAYGIQVDLRQLRNACYLYDNAVAICAFLASPHSEDQRRAFLIADAFVQLAEFEKPECEKQGWQGTRLRNAYACGDLLGWKVDRPAPCAGYHEDASGPLHYVRGPRPAGKYDSNPMILGDRPAPKWYIDAYGNGSDSGNIAWACLALLNCWERSGNPRYLDTVRKLARGVLDVHKRRQLGVAKIRAHQASFPAARDENCPVPSDTVPPGFCGGIEWTGEYNKLGCFEDVPEPWQSTEHNIDLAVVFRRLERVEAAGPGWDVPLGWAQKFLRWATMSPSAPNYGGKHYRKEPEQGGFGAGAKPFEPHGREYLVRGNVGTADWIHHPIPLDVQAWSVLAFYRGNVFPPRGDGSDDLCPARFATAMNWADAHCRVASGPLQGYTFAAPGPELQPDFEHDIWPEGTAQGALAWRAMGQAARADRLLATLDDVVRLAAFDGPAHGAMPAAFPRKVETGFWLFKTRLGYYRLPHVGATAWYVMAKLNFNPFWGGAVEEAPP